MSLTLAKHLLAASVHKAVLMGLRCDIAIADEGGNMVAFYRMDQARAGDIEVSQNKAWSSVALKMPTSVIAQMAQPGGDAYGINTTNNGRVVILGGGIPLRSRNKVIGGVGVSGGTSAQDAEVADAAVQAFHYLASHAT
ncbi:heme-binding protein [Paenibacillus montanisoli]|uniref:Heme-binding protein n=2 Tax=Paenibacillus montanisoli TaxID=2081970 RepID=A0A328U9F8_9BACL|nr:heme-binding protein [Paenibacillus montanisoli]